MNAIDSLLSGEEPIVQMIIDEEGTDAAHRFVDLFNNACMQLAGFEEFLVEYNMALPGCIAPITNMSSLEH